MTEKLMLLLRSQLYPPKAACLYADLHRALEWAGYRVEEVESYPDRECNLPRVKYWDPFSRRLIPEVVVARLAAQPMLLMRLARQVHKKHDGKANFRIGEKGLLVLAEALAKYAQTESRPE